MSQNRHYPHMTAEALAQPVLTIIAYCGPLYRILGYPSHFGEDWSIFAKVSLSFQKIHLNAVSG